MSNNLDNSPQLISVISVGENRDVESANNNKLVKNGQSKPKFYKNDKNKTEQKNNIDLEKNVIIKEHLMEIDEVCALLKTDLKTGLTEAEAFERLHRDGPNAFTPPKQTPGWVIFLKEQTSGFALLLWFSSIAFFIIYGIQGENENLYLGVILAFTVLLTGTFSYYQQYSSSKVFKSFKNMVPPKTDVIRDGVRKQIQADHIVVGDIVMCKSGDRVPADIRVVHSESMKVDNSSLTGESDPLTRNPKIGHKNPLEARNLAFFSTNCVDGSGTGIVIATGDRTVMGDIARLVTNIKNEKTPMAKEITRFSKMVTILAITCGVIFFAISMGFGTNFINSFIFTIGITVGNVPEGLLPALTVALTLTAKRLAKKNCLVKQLQGVETLGSVTTICTDKTGTLTMNRMTVEHCCLADNIYRVSHDREDVADQMSSISKAWDAYKRCAILCSRSEFTDDNPDIMKRACAGDASETAILRFMESVEGPVVKYRAQYPKVAEKPFSSTYKYQFSIHSNSTIDTNSVDGTQVPNHILVMKGAPERIIKMCLTYLSPGGETLTIDDDFHKVFEETYRELGSMGERVLALCDHEFTQFPKDHKFDLEEGNEIDMFGFRFLGLIAMIDPPRPTVPDAVERCRKAGIKVIMVTGDHPITAQAIAKSVGILTNSHRRSTSIAVLQIDKLIKNSRSVVIPGDELSEMDDQKLQDILNGFGEIVFARTSPQQKLRIVENCQSLGQIVAVTGDGVNDSPALKKADIGIAMGITGSEVSKQAADMILLDDNFATIVTGIEEGRRIFDNMKKVVSYILTGNVTTVYPFLVYVVFGFPLAIGTITCLLIALGTDMVPAISLAYERAESDIMSLPPRNATKDRLVTNSLLARAYLQMGIMCSAAGFYSYFVAMGYEGFKPSELWQLRHNWDDENAVINKYGPGDDWNLPPTIPTTYAERAVILSYCQSAYFAGIVIVQYMDVIVNKTRRLSFFTQGMGNWVLNFSILFETALACLFIYTPDLNTVLSLAPVVGQCWYYPIPFFFYIFIVEEIRKFIIRRFPLSFLAKELLV